MRCHDDAGSPSGRKPLSGQVALVSGGAKGIGNAICRQLAELGASIALTGAQDVRSAERTAAELADSGSKALAFAMDLTDRDSVDATVGAVVERLGRLDIVVNNAGASRRGRLLDLASEDWNHVFAVQTLGFLHLAVAGARQMIAQGGGGSIIAIAGASALRCYPGNGAYGPSKAAVLATVRQMAVEWAGHEIRVNAVLPGPIREVDEDWRTAEPRLAAEVQRIPLKRVGTPQDVAQAVAYLSTAGYVTGQNIVVDGGSTTTWYIDGRA
ncbi:SDR family NAD(P)-dependent oxidoreductase [Labrys monachus]|uniref:NAD(P)-dependent dehydrogenase (Short-subunit alcohol dehydrogenase family) n=1 Tax=Labrys monachus TaxID=217067 RepID=A0ABU0FEW1_9HYPH|nr:SDR family NAD(P)-dependent oxidoreductase [Labrys monachus]MDQ0393148.1 NAD(P)-dependent dehydrogenase (short-subunit alcohol dehydrogenase family) [Labrys monachus]